MSRQALQALIIIYPCQISYWSTLSSSTVQLRPLQHCTLLHSSASFISLTCYTHDFGIQHVYRIHPISCFKPWSSSIQHTNQIQLVPKAFSLLSSPLSYKSRASTCYQYHQQTTATIETQPATQFYLSIFRTRRSSFKPDLHLSRIQVPTFHYLHQTHPKPSISFVWSLIFRARPSNLSYCQTSHLSTFICQVFFLLDEKDSNIQSNKPIYSPSN